MTYYYCRAIRERKLCQGQDLTRNVSWGNMSPGLMLNVLQCHRGWQHRTELMYITFYKCSTVTLAVYFIPFLRYCQFYAEMTLLGDCDL